MYFINLDFIDLATAGRSLACVASVFVGLYARSRNFSLFGGAQIGASATLMEGMGRGGEGRGGLALFCARSNFRAFKKRKMLQASGRPNEKRLLRRLTPPELPNQCNTIDNCHN